MFFAARYVGGLSTSRSHKGDKDAAKPVELIDVKQQREALKMLEEHVFSDEPFDFPPELYSYMATSNWRHWGSSSLGSRKDFPIHDVISMWQGRIIDQLLSSTTLERMHDTELKAADDAEVLTTAELMERLSKSVFKELDEVKKGDYSNRQPAISSLRRNLQREYLRKLSYLAMGNTYAPDDCQTVAYLELSDLKDKMEKLLEADLGLDTYTRAHLRESANRIEKVLDARLTLSSP
jgi:hypothetical protein